MNRTISQQVQGYETTDGAGVHLVRVLGGRTTDAYDPLLMLDSFDSTDPSKYRAGFPLHPHRGIETISYLWKGRMVHKDSIGNHDEISDGEVQWMTAGSGIMHEEMLPESERMLGVQLWLNLPKKYKMVKPNYHAIRRDEIQEVEFDGGFLRIIAGEYEGIKGYEAQYQPLTYYDIHLEEGASITLSTETDDSLMVFTLLGEISVEGEHVPAKTAAKLSEGTSVTLKAENGPAQILYVLSKRLDEPIAWGGPIVMNTTQELEQAFEDLRTGNFLRDEVEYNL